MFTQFEEGNLLSENRDNAESGEKSDEDSNTPPLTIKAEMYAMYSGDESDDKPISTEMLEDIRNGSKSNTIVNKKYACYNIHDRIKKDNQNGKERYYLRETWVKVYTKCLKLLSMRFFEFYQFWVNMAQHFLILFWIP